MNAGSSTPPVGGVGGGFLFQPFHQSVHRQKQVIRTNLLFMKDSLVLYSRFKIKNHEARNQHPERDS